MSGFATFKKKAGLITIHEDRTPAVLVWKPADTTVTGQSSAIEFVLSTISNLQATPATSPAMKLKIVTIPSEGAEPVQYLFSFNNRLVMDNVKESLTQIVARYKTAKEVAKSGTTTPAAPGEPMVTSTFSVDALDSKQLLKNHQLQQKLLIENKSLMSTFKEAVMNQGLDPSEFWATRVHLLRAFALTNSQKRGPYNVLSTIKPTATSDNQVNVSVTREKIHVIFEQYPVVRKAYDDNVPRISEGEFWSRFFSSKLFRKLRGEKISTNVRGDYVLDKYINMDVDYEKHEDENLNHKVNKVIDLEGNTEDDTTKLGNAPDHTMKPNAVPETVSTLKSMNRLSQKMVNSLEHQYSRSNTPEVSQKSKEEIENERVRDELIFNDLETPHVTEYAEIHVNNQYNEKEEINNKRSHLMKEEYVESIKRLKTGLDTKFDLQSVFSKDRKPGIEKSAADIISSIRLNAKQSKQSWQIYKSLEEQANHQVVDEIDPTFDLNLLEQLRLTHATSIEFLRHFWLHFNSGDPSQVASLKNLQNSLIKSQGRIKSALDGITDQKTKQKSFAYFKPLIESLTTAIRGYQRAVQESTLANGQVTESPGTPNV